MSKIKLINKPPLSYMGSKVQELDKIINNLPLNFNKFIDVFGGGGSVSLAMLQEYPTKQIFYNDVDKEMAELFEILKSKDKTKKLINDINDIRSTIKNNRREIFDSYVYPDLPKRFYLAKTGFRGNHMNHLPNLRDGKLDSVNFDLSYLTKYNNKMLQRLKITNNDCFEVIEQYRNDEDAILYMDPPYISTSQNQYKNKFSVAQIERIAQIFKDKTVKCKLMLHIEFIGYTYHLFHDYLKVYYPKRYNLETKPMYKKYIMIATNY